MGKIEVKGIDTLIAFTAGLAKEADSIIKASMYDGAKILADEARNATEALHTEDGGAKPPKYINTIQKKGLLKGLGVMRYRKEDGKWMTVIGFSGYNDLKTKKYPQGQPNAMIARSVESGTSWQTKEPFMRKAAQRAKARATAAVQQTFEKEIERRQK